MARIGIIGGSGLYDLDGLEDVDQLTVETPFGSPSDKITRGTLGGQELFFLPRHGRGHRLLPSEVPYRANIFSLKTLGVEWLLSVSAVGSLKEGVHPGDFLVPDQYVDRTRGRPSTFFGNGVVAHVSFADPTCPGLCSMVADAVGTAGVKVHKHGNYVCMEGPAFSTRTESYLYRQWGMDVIGMTAIPEAKLAREAQLHYATLALVTDYDCWHDAEEDVSVDSVLDVLRNNVANVKTAITELVPLIADDQQERQKCNCATSLQGAILTPPEAIDTERRDHLAVLAPEFFTD